MQLGLKKEREKKGEKLHQFKSHRFTLRTRLDKSDCCVHIKTYRNIHLPVRYGMHFVHKKREKQKKKSRELLTQNLLSANFGLFCIFVLIFSTNFHVTIIIIIILILIIIIIIIIIITFS